MSSPSILPVHNSDQPVELLIRQMSAADLEQVQAIDQLSFALPWPQRAFRYELEDNPHSRQWVAEIVIAKEPHQQSGNLDSPPGNIAGYLVMWLILDEAHIATVAVHPDLRGMGIAQELLAAALNEAIQLGSTVATLEVRAGNEIAQKLYRRFGFQIVGKRPRYYKDNQEDAIIMTTGKLDQKMHHWLKAQGWKKDHFKPGD
jgi:ribosomal-protein-alanine N-acetyltransferase